VRSILILALLAGAAHAEVREFGWPKRSIGVHFGMGGTYLGAESVGGPLIDLEYGIGRKRWQFVTEGQVRWVPLDGVNPRLGGAARWLARSWKNAEAKIELFLDLGLGGEVFAIPGTVVARPTARVGWGLQINNRDKWRIQMIMRATFAPSLDRDTRDAIACRGPCMRGALDGSPIDDGIEGAFGVSW
jgi:hypothetical protein